MYRQVIQTEILFIEKKSIKLYKLLYKVQSVDKYIINVHVLKKKKILSTGCFFHYKEIPVYDKCPKINSLNYCTELQFFFCTDIRGRSKKNPSYDLEIRLND